MCSLSRHPSLEGSPLANSYDLEGKSALVTGGAGGIGRAIVDLLLKSGARVEIWDARPVAIDGVRSRVVDISRPAEIAAAVDGSGPGIDILVNDAGYLGRTQAFVEHPVDDWKRIIAVNLLGTMQVTQAILPTMLRAGAGRIVNLGSLAGKEGLGQLAAYSAASAGIIAFTKALSREVVDKGVFVNCVAPGPIDTEMIRELGPATVTAMIAESPMHRLGSADEVAQLVVWLCSDASRFNAGAVFDVSGGRARY